MSKSIIVYVTIENLNDTLTQAQWAGYVHLMREAIRDVGILQHAEWFSASDSGSQSACWCLDIHHQRVELFKAKLAWLSRWYNQESIIWAQAEQSLIMPQQADD
jgi:hypothetical protein